jgi:purine-binding chemotaxis protein CheW
MSQLKIVSQTIQYCGFRIANEHYAVPVIDVQEVVKPMPVTSIPLSEEFVRGLINLRGQIVTSISLRRMFGLKENTTAEHMNVIVREGDSLFSLVVDEILDVVEIDEEIISKTPETIPLPLKNFVSGIYRTNQELIIILDLKKILSF